MDIRSIITSAPASLPRVDERDEVQQDYRGTLPDSLMVVLDDGRIICIGQRDGYLPDRIWVMGPDGDDLAEWWLPEPAVNEPLYQPDGTSSALLRYQAEGR